MLCCPLTALHCTGPVRVQSARIPQGRDAEGDGGPDAGDFEGVHQPARPDDMPTPPLAGPDPLQACVVVSGDRTALTNEILLSQLHTPFAPFEPNHKLV